MPNTLWTNIWTVTALEPSRIAFVAVSLNSMSKLVIINQTITNFTKKNELYRIFSTMSIFTLINNSSATLERGREPLEYKKKTWHMQKL